MESRCYLWRHPDTGELCCDAQRPPIELVDVDVASWLVEDFWDKKTMFCLVVDSWPELLAWLEREQELDALLEADVLLFLARSRVAHAD